MAQKKLKQSESEIFEDMVMAAERLSLGQFNALTETKRTAYTKGRMAFLDGWFALLELGIPDTAFSTFAQRLDYALERYAIERYEVDKNWIKQEAWAENASIPPGYLSEFRNRTFASGKVNHGIDEESITVARHVLALLRVARYPVDVAWVLHGSGLDTLTFTDRYRFVLRARYGSPWKEAARNAQLYPPELEEHITKNEQPPVADQQRWAQALATAIGPALSAPWLVTGKTEPPPEIHAVMRSIEAEGPITRWDARMDVPASMTMRPREILVLVQLVEKYGNTLPADVLDRIRIGLWIPMTLLGLASPLLYIKGAAAGDENAHLSEDQIRKRRQGVYKAFRQRPAG